MFYRRHLFFPVYPSYYGFGGYGAVSVFMIVFVLPIVLSVWLFIMVVKYGTIAAIILGALLFALGKVIYKAVVNRVR